MNLEKVWNDEYGVYTSRAFLKRNPESKTITIDLRQCIIMINRFGYFDLMLNGKKIKRVDFHFYLKHRLDVKGVTNETY